MSAPRRQFDLYTFERRATRIAFGLLACGVRRGVLTRYLLADWARKVRGAL
jgi:hypothetical protein